MKTFPAAPARQPDQPWLMHVPVISTAHFTSEEAGGLYERAFLRSEDGQVSLLCLEDEDLVHPVLQHFRNLGYRYLRLDPDGDVLADFPTHSW